MKKNFVHYYFLISCPGDVETDVKTVLESIENVNQTVGDQRLVHIVPLFWKKDVIPTAGDKAQNIINQQILKKADGVIALFWTRFGTPTDKYGSGTEEEIDLAIKENKDVLLFCSQKLISPEVIEQKQYAKLKNFKKNYNGLFASYQTENELKDKLKTALIKLVFDYSERNKEAFSEYTNSINSIYSLSDYYELGWFVARSKIELPRTNEDAFEISSFNDRMNSLINISNYYNILDANMLQTLYKYKETISRYGLEGFLTRENISFYNECQEIINICGASLSRKLANSYFAAFQLGMSIGRYILILLLENITENHSSYAEALLACNEEMNNEYQNILSCSKHFGDEIYSIINETKNFCDKNVELSVEEYNEIWNKTAERIMKELKLK